MDQVQKNRERESNHTLKKIIESQGGKQERRNDQRTARELLIKWE